MTNPIQPARSIEELNLLPTTPNRNPVSDAIMKVLGSGYAPSAYQNSSIMLPSSFSGPMTTDPRVVRGAQATGITENSQSLAASLARGGADFLSSVKQAADVLNDAAQAIRDAAQGVSGSRHTRGGTKSRAGTTGANSADADVIGEKSATSGGTGVPDSTSNANAGGRGGGGFGPTILNNPNAARGFGPGRDPEPVPDSVLRGDDAIERQAEQKEFNQPVPSAYMSSWNRHGSHFGFYNQLQDPTRAIFGRLGGRLKGYQNQRTRDIHDKYNVAIEDGKNVLYHKNPDGTNGERATGPEVDSDISHLRRVGNVQGFGARLEQGGLLEALPIGEVGLAYGAVRLGYNSYMSQQNESRQYQSIEGGGIGHGYGERVSESAFRFHNLGSLSGAQANELFMGATEQGYRGSDRNAALSVAVEQFRRNGTTIQQTLQLMSVAAETGGKALNGVNDALNSVTDTATKNGLNAAQQRQNFISSYSSIAEVSGSSTAATAQLAAADTNVTSGLGAKYASVNLNGMESPVNLRRQAAALGLPFGTFLAEQGENPQIGAAGQQALIRQGVQAVFNNHPQAVSFLQKGYAALQKQAGPGKPILKSSVEALAEQAQKQYGLDPQAFQSIFQAQGIPTTLENSVGYGVNSLLGTSNPLAEVEKNQSDSKQKTFNRADAPDHSVAKYVEKVAGNSLFNTRQGWDSSNGSSPLAAYESVIDRTGKTDPVIENLIKKSNLSTSDKYRYQVSTGQGLRDVKLSDAIKYYGDQLQTGNVKLVGNGANNGRTISEVTGGLGTGGDITKQASSKNNTTKGFLADSAKGKKADAGQATVTISPSTTLLQLFNFSPTGNVAIQAGAAAGLPPSSVPTQQLPNGQLG